MEKPELIAFSENVLGGIQTFYFNLLSNSVNTNFDIKWLLIDHTNETRAKAPYFPIKNLKVKYNNGLGRWRKAYQIAKHISNKPGIILANREFELDALALYPKPNKIIYHVVHDDYYIQFALKYQYMINVYIVHNKFIYDELLRLLPTRKDDINFLPYGIRLSPYQRESNLNRKLKIAFIARLDISKGIHDLCKIDDALIKLGVNVDWLIIGDGPEKNDFLASIKNREHFKHLIAKDDLEIFENIQTCDIFVLPSIHDGTPVSLLESMSAGLVPIIYNFNDGIKEVVNEDVGYIVTKGNFNQIAVTIYTLDSNRALLELKSKKSKIAAKNKYNIIDRSKDYFALLNNYNSKMNINYKPELYNLFLESPLIPQKIATFLSKYFFKSKPNC